jgi:LysM repeat protein
VSRKSLLWIILILAALGGGCAATGGQETITATASPSLVAITPYQTNTPAQTVTPTASAAATPTLPPLPTPTPYLYTIILGDTLIGIASYFGVTTEELIVANPGVDPNFLSVGKQLVIPLPAPGPGDENPLAPSETEMLPLQTGAVACYRVRSGGWWCYLPVSNTLEQPAENISGLIRLFDSEGQEVASQPASGLVNVLRPGERFALAAFFPPPVAEWTASQGQLVSAVAASQLEARYLELDPIEVTITPLAEDQLSVEVSGSISLPAPADGSEIPAIESLWVLATAYDADGAIAGLRRWESAPQETSEPIPFRIELYSLGKPIDQVEILTEARLTP